MRAGRDGRNLGRRRNQPGDRSERLGGGGFDEARGETKAGARGIDREGKDHDLRRSAILDGY